MTQEITPLKVEGENVARAAYQSDGSFGTSPPQWGIASIIIDPRYQTPFIVTGLLMWGFAYVNLNTHYSNILFTIISYVLIAIGTLLVLRSLIRISSIWNDKTIRFRQMTLFFDRIRLLPEGLEIKFDDIELVTHEVSYYHSITETYLQEDVHIFTVTVKGAEYRCRWYGPSPNAVFDDNNLNMLLYYLGFRQVENTKFMYNTALTPGPPMGFIPMNPGLMTKNVNSVTVLASLAVVAAVIYFVWNSVAVKITQ